MRSNTGRESNDTSLFRPPQCIPECRGRRPPIGLEFIASVSVLHHRRRPLKKGSLKMPAINPFHDGALFLWYFLPRPNIFPARSLSFRLTIVSNFYLHTIRSLFSSAVPLRTVLRSFQEATGTTSTSLYAEIFRVGSSARGLLNTSDRFLSHP